MLSTSAKGARRVVLEARMAMFATRRPAAAGCRASKQTGLALESRNDIPAEISELLVDALESHGGVWVWMWVLWVAWVCMCW